MSTLLVVFFVISTSDDTPFERTSDSEKDPDGRIFYHDVDDDYGIQSDQNTVKKRYKQLPMN